MSISHGMYKLSHELSQPNLPIYKTRWKIYPIKMSMLNFGKVGKLNSFFSISPTTDHLRTGNVLRQLLYHKWQFNWTTTRPITTMGGHNTVNVSLDLNVFSFSAYNFVFEAILCNAYIQHLYIYIYIYELHAA